jgi:coatomer subunit beta
MDFLGDSSNPSALDVVAFVRFVISRLSGHTLMATSLRREVVEKFPHLRQTICDKLLPTLGEIKSGKVFRGILWILGEYLEGDAGIKAGIQEIRKVLGEIPILASEQRLLDEVEGDGEEVKNSQPAKVEGGGRPRVLADGTYATEIAFMSTTTAKLEAIKAAAKPPLRSKCLKFP